MSAAPTTELSGKRVLVMGLGVHGGGLGVVRFLAGEGARVTVTDLRTAEQLQTTLDQLRDLPVTYVLGEHRDEDFQSADIVIRNPGVPRESRYLQIARAAGAAVEMEMTLFFRLCRGPIVGITGTKGKTTTTMLTGAIFREQYPDTVVAGNMRVSALEQLPRIGPETPVILELSSWQLEGLGEAGLSPRYACITNLSEDHLDRYGSMEAYAEAKAQIFRHQCADDVVVLNADDPLTRDLYEVTPGGPDKIRFADRRTRTDVAADELAPQALGLPVPHAVWQAGSDGGRLIWRDYDDYEQRYLRDEICSVADVQLPGDHNLANVAAAAALAKAFGIETANIRRGIQGFAGVPDRMEPVRTLGGVRYINDTTATAPAAAIAAVRSLDVAPIVIAGGADKRLQFDELGAVLAARAKAIVLLQGTATPKLQAALDAALAERADGPQVLGPFDALRPAVVAAAELAKAGDVVLLSPGCASFGMFRNEFDRGEQFRKVVGELGS